MFGLRVMAVSLALRGSGETGDERSGDLGVW